MPDLVNPTIYPELKLVFVQDDNQGHYYLKASDADGKIHVWPLSLKRATYLASEVLRAAKDIAAAAPEAGQ